MSRFYNYPLRDFDKWSPDLEPLPDLTGLPMWPNAPWNTPLRRFETDDDLTYELTQLHMYSPGPQVVRLSHGQRSQQWAGGVPYQFAGKNRVAIGRYNVAVHGVKKDYVYLPDGKIKRTGDPNALGHDLQAFIIDPQRRTYTEVSNINDANPLVRTLHRTSLQCSQAHEFDLTKDWTLTRGTVAAKVPLIPMIPRPEEFRAGKITHAMQLCVGGYSNAKPIGYARDTDGKIKGHPLVAGQMLRLRPEALARVAQNGTRDAATLGVALLEYGVMVADFTSPEVGHALRLPATRTIDLGNMTLDISDFEAVKTPNYPF